MQNRYVGDIGDFVKYGLLRALAENYKLGVAWYLFPDENRKGKQQIKYLEHPEEWAYLDKKLFKYIDNLVLKKNRTVKDIECSNILNGVVFANEPLESSKRTALEKINWRNEWFKRVLAKLSDCDIVFVSSKSVCDDEKFIGSKKTHWQKIPLKEIDKLSHNKTVIVHHHNSRFLGGHYKEIEYWMQKINGCTYSIYWKRYSCRTFFIVKPSKSIEKEIKKFTSKWSENLALISLKDQSNNLINI